MMSRHISASLLRSYNCNISASLFRNYNCKLNLSSSHFGTPHFISSSLPNICFNHRLDISTVPENIQVSKYVKPFINQPVEEILAGTEKKSISGPESVSILKALRMQILFKGASRESFKDDSRFKIICKAFEKNCMEMKPNLIVSGLRSLLEVGVSTNSSYVVSAQKSILSNIQNFSAFHVIGCLYYHHKYIETDLQKKVIFRLIDQLEKTVNEISTSAEVLMLVHILHLFDKEFQKHLEQKIIDILPSLQVNEMCKLICLLAEKSNRNVLILNNLAFFMRQKLDKPDLSETVDIFYAFKKLNFFDPKLFGYLLNHFEDEISSVKQASLISGLLTACGHMRWRHTGILENCGNWIKNNLNHCKSREFISYVLTVAALNFSNLQVKIILEKITPHFTVKNISSPDALLNITWSLGILDSVPKGLLLEVLSPEFYKPLVEHSDIQTKVSNQLKLLNLKGILKKNYPEFIFGCDLFLDPIKLPESSVIEKSRQHVVNVLSILIPKEKFLSVNQVSDTGIFIDAEFILNEKEKPLPIQEFGLGFRESKPIPDGCKRVAILVMFQKDFTHCSRELTGVNALGTRLLKNAGYTVIYIPYEEFSKTKTDVQKVKFLSDKIKKALHSGS
ncbi:FAST kinase domain-containing protein 4-like [Argiope bruennichi]|uniref:FAST kinase domain-containing protein 4 n=1 Tax=Argiope bruennichi TaxID=94029 RepID=A0A8T0FXK2_ARGBR|nr:FAST kinase domain-containing protein 4-like [Argiope bruennichi]XP_055948592.1 FAST kinase domain-containing protein 4-like [Argiope bruennichi]KAF8795791.1 FAST kinase domain-containing protein 4 [Argiope bruennichi]